MNITLKFTWYFKKEGDQVVVSLNPSLASIFYFFLSMFSPKWDKKWVFACQNFGVRTAWVKLELTDFSSSRWEISGFCILSFCQIERI